MTEQTATPVDVNQAFADTRAAQYAARSPEALDARVASGELTKLNDGRYRVNSGWDSGEYLTAQGTAITQLDESTGEVALFTSRPAWHNLGSVIEGGTTDLDKAMELARVDFTVEKVPSTFTYQGITREVEGKFATVRSDTGAGLGVVGTVYTAIQPREGFDFLLGLVEKGQATWDSMGATRGGRRVFASMRLPEDVHLDVEGGTDTVRQYVTILNSFDGTTPLTAVVSPWMVVCGNTERFAVRDAVTKWTVRHTRNAMDKVREAQRTLKLTTAYYRAWVAEEQILAQQTATLDDVAALIEGLWEKPNPLQDSAKTVNSWQRRADAIVDLYQSGPNTPTAGHTLYGAERAITCYLDNVAPLRPRGSLRGDLDVARGQALIEGSTDKTKDAAHRLLLVRAGA